MNKNKKEDIHPDSTMYTLNVFHLITFFIWIYFVFTYASRGEWSKLKVPTFIITTAFFFMNMYRSLAPVTDMNKACCRLDVFETHPWFKKMIQFNTPPRDRILSNLSNIALVSIFSSVLFVIGFKLKALFSPTEWKCLTQFLFMTFFIVVSIEVLRWWNWDTEIGEFVGGDGESGSGSGSGRPGSNQVHMFRNGLWGALSLASFVVLIILSRHTYRFIGMIIDANMKNKSTKNKTHYHQINGELNTLLYYFIFPFLLLTGGGFIYYIFGQVIGQYVHSTYKGNENEDIDRDIGVIEIMLRRFSLNWKEWNEWINVFPNICITTIIQNFVGLYLYFIFDKYAYANSKRESE